MTDARKPLGECELVQTWPVNHGHVFQTGDQHWYPCLGCGCEKYSPLATLPCQKPYTDPVAVGSLLTEIRDILLRIEAKL